MKKIKSKMGLIIIIAFALSGLFISSVFIQVLNLPRSFHLSPGQKLKISAYFPLDFYALVTDQRYLQQSHVFLSSNLTLGSRSHHQFDLQIRAFGRIPIREMHVDVSQPPLVVPGGQAIGVLMSSRGVVVVGRVPVTAANGRQYFPAKDADIRDGDLLLAINGLPVNRIEDVELILKSLKRQTLLHLTVIRQSKTLHLNILPIPSSNGTVSGNVFRLGLFIEDPAAGVGTLTFYDPESRQFAGLGHHVSEFAGKKSIPFQTGEIVMASINGIRSGSPGQPGEKIGVFHSNAVPVGRIFKNSQFGIYGKLYPLFTDLNHRVIPVAYSNEISPGPATIYTVLKGTKIEAFTVEIVKVYRQDSPHDKGMVIKVTDPELLRQTGGIIQGMSGSPIIQNGKFVGAVTHVLVNDPTRGYGVLAEWMMEELRNSLKLTKAS